MNNTYRHHNHCNTQCTSVLVQIIPEADPEKRILAQRAYLGIAEIKLGIRDGEGKAIIKRSVIKQLLLWTTELNPTEKAPGASLRKENLKTNKQTNKQTKKPLSTLTGHRQKADGNY